MRASRKTIPIFAVGTYPLVPMVLLAIASGTSAAEQTRTSPTASPQVEGVLRQLRLKLPKKSDDEIIALLRGYVSDDKSTEVGGVGWFTEKLERAKKQHETVERIKSNWALWTVYYDYEWAGFGMRPRNGERPGPACLRKLVGDDFFTNVVSISVGFDYQIESLAGLPRLQHLDLFIQ